MSRFNRQEGIVNQQALAQKRIMVVGTGAVGRNVALALASLGAKYISFFDFDIVEEVNLCTQGWNKEDIGTKKVQALLKDMKQKDYEEDAQFFPIDKKWTPSRADKFDPQIIFACVDNMDGRKQIYEYFKSKPSIEAFFDGRMLGENIQVLSAIQSDGDDSYAETLFHDDEAEEGRCTRRSTYHASQILANYLVGQMTAHLRGIQPSRKVVHNVLDFLV